MAKPKSRILDAAITSEKKVLRLQVAMHDALVVGGRQPAHDLRACIVSRLADGKWTAPKAVAERLAFQQLGDNIGCSLLFADVRRSKECSDG